MPYTQTTLGWRRLPSRSASRSRSRMATLELGSPAAKNRLGFRHLTATSLLCHLPRYTCARGRGGAASAQGRVG